MYIMDIREAISKAENAFAGLKVAYALDIGTAWVFGFIGENGEPVDISPCSVRKLTGEIEEFFPPDHIEELEMATEIEI